MTEPDKASLIRRIRIDAADLCEAFALYGSLEDAPKKNHAKVEIARGVNHLVRNLLEFKRLLKGD